MSPENLALQAREDLRLVMATESGRRWMYTVLDARCGVWSPSMLGSSEATHATAHAEGRRAVGIGLLAEVLRDAPGEYVRMLQEALNRQQASDLQRREQSNAGGESD